MADSEAAGPGGAATTAELEQALRELLEALRQSDTAAAELLQRLAGRVEAGEAPSGWQALLGEAHQAIERYDFDSAATLLAPLLEARAPRASDVAG